MTTGLWIRVKKTNLSFRSDCQSTLIQRSDRKEKSTGVLGVEEFGSVGRIKGRRKGMGNDPGEDNAIA